MREKPLRRAAARDVTLGGSVSQIIALAWKSCEFAHFPQIQPICFLRATPCEAVSHLQRVSSRGPASQPEASVCPVTPASSGGGSGGSGALPSPHSARTPGRCCPAGYDSSLSSVWGGRCSQLLGPARAPSELPHARPPFRKRPLLLQGVEPFRAPVGSPCPGPVLCVENGWWCPQGPAPSVSLRPFRPLSE